jgi:hypothetical protein
MLTLCLTIGIFAYMKYSREKDLRVFVMYLFTAVMDVILVTAILGK